MPDAAADSVVWIEKAGGNDVFSEKKHGKRIFVSLPFLHYSGIEEIVSHFAVMPTNVQ